MTLDDLRALADKFFVWPECSGRQTVTTFSALLFAQHVLQLREKSLGTENSAGMDALRNAAQRQLEALAAYRREIGLLTGVPDEQPCDAEIALRAALEQDESEGSVCIRCGALAFDPLVPQQAEPTRSQQMADAGFKPRDRRLECDECGGKFTAQMLPIHKCAQQVARLVERAHGIGEEK